MNILEERLNQAGDELRDAVDRMPARQAPTPRPLRSALAFATGVATILVLVAIPVWLLSGTGPDDRLIDSTPVEGGVGSGDVFMLPGFVPDGFHLARALIVDVNQRSTSNPADAAGVVLEYLPDGQFGRQAGEPWFLIRVMDRLATVAAIAGQEDLRCFTDEGTEIECYEGPRPSSCTGEPAMAENRMDPEVCMDETEDRTPKSFGGTNVYFRRTTVRDLPAHVVQVEGGDFDLSITTYEGGPVLSEVTGDQVDEEVLLQIANELHHVDAQEFDDMTTAATDTGPTPEEILSDGVVTRSEYQMAGERVVECLTRLGFEARMEPEADRAPSFIVRDDVGSERAFKTCHGRHVGSVERAWADQNAPTPEEEARFYNSVVSCVESEIGEELGEYTGQKDSELLDELLDTRRGTYMRCLEARADQQES